MSPSLVYLSPQSCAHLGHKVTPGTDINGSLRTGNIIPQRMVLMSLYLRGSHGDTDTENRRVDTLREGACGPTESSADHIHQVPVAQPCPTLCDAVTVAHQAPLSRRFSRQGYWSGLPFPSPGDLPNPGIEPRSPALLADSLPTELRGKPTRELIYTTVGKASKATGVQPQSNCPPF